MEFEDCHNELKESKVASVVIGLYDLLKGSRRRAVAWYCFRILFKLEGGAYRSLSVRKLLYRDYQVYVGVHSYGELFVPGAFAPSVRVGKYCSIASNVKVYTQNHPLNSLSTHPYFYEKQFGIIAEDALEPAETVIGNDVWIGNGAILLPGCKTVGDGAVIGAGAIVTKDVPPFAVVAGNPAKVVKYRFSEADIAKLIEAQWWNKRLADLANIGIDDMLSGVEV